MLRKLEKNRYTKFLLDKYLKYKELFNYLFFGVLSTVINILTFYICEKIFPSQTGTSIVNIFGINLNSALLINNSIAWVVAVIFAYITNKLWVFESKSFEIKVISKELTSFMLGRVFSLVVEQVILIVFIEQLGMNTFIVKICANFIVIILNFFISKLFAFKKKK